VFIVAALIKAVIARSPAIAGFAMTPRQRQLYCDVDYTFFLRTTNSELITSLSLLS